MSRHWTSAQVAAINARGLELGVSAAAGSGKTSVLVERVCCAALGQRLEAAGTASPLPGGPLALERVLVVTFTHAAAAELRARLHERLAKELEQRLSTGGEARLVRGQLAALNLAQIGTLHGFCLELVRRYGYLRGLNAGRVLSEHESQLALHEQASRFLDEALGQGDAELMRMALDWGGQDGVGAEDLSRSGRAGRGLRPLLLSLYEFRRSLPDPEAWYAQFAQWPPLDPAHCDPAHPLLVGLEEQWRRLSAEILLADSALLANLAGTPPDEAYPHILRQRAHMLEQLSLVRGWDELNTFIKANLETRVKGIFNSPSLLGAYYRSKLIDEDPLLSKIVQHKTSCQERVKSLREALKKPWIEVATEQNHVQAQLARLWQLTADFAARYGAYKRERGWLDYGDMEQGALELLSAHDEASDAILHAADGRLLPSSVALELRAKYLEVLVDEYQDTSPLQDAILDLVTPALPLEGGAEYRPRFVVGDLKQSIYSFRLAEPALFSALQARLRALAQEEVPPGRLIPLRENFRSRREILAAINLLFSGLLTPELGGENYDDNSLIYSAGYEPFDSAEAQPAASSARVSMHLIRAGAAAAAQTDAGDAESEDGATESTTPEDPAPDEDESDDDVALGGSALQRGVYDCVAQRLLALKREAEAGRLKVLDRVLDEQGAEQAGLREAGWRDMVILLRSSRGRVEKLREALERAGVPCLALGRSGFYERPEVLDALSLLRVIDNPLADVPLASVLRGPAVGLSPAQLLQLSRPDVFSRSADDEAQPPDNRTPLWERLHYSLANHGDAELRERLLDFTARLARWREAARDTPLHLLLHRLYREAGLLPAAAGALRAQQRLANLRELQRLARDFSGFERQGVSRFLAFIEQSRMAAGDSGEAVLAAGQAEQVRILTVHQSKGLEFPIVLLPDLHKQFNERELSGSDLLWHARAGLGARFYDLAAKRPRRSETLSLRRLRQAKRRELLSEELRLLYVALTRARERLELFAGLPPRFKLDKASVQPPEESHSWLDWLALRFGAQMQQCFEQGSAVLLDDGAPLFEFVLVQAQPTAVNKVEHALEPEHLELPAAPLLQPEQAAWLREALTRPYPFEAATRLPGKLTVTKLSHGASARSSSVWQDTQELETELTLPADEADEPPPALWAVQPVCAALAADARSVEAAAAVYDPRAVGTATHRLLAELDPAGADFGSYADAAALATLREKLSAHGQLDAGAAQHIALPALARLVTELRPLLASLLAQPDAQALRELPIALSVPAAEIASALGQTAADAASLAGDMVYVQGTLDLLVLGRRQALVLDYKTDRGASAEKLLALYRQQLAWYCRAVAALLPGCTVRWAIYGLGGAGLLGPFDAA